MKLLQQVNNTVSRLKEDAAGGAVGAGSVAMNATPLFSMMVKRSVPTATPTEPKKKKKKKGLGIQEAFDALGAAPVADDSRSPSDPTADAEGVVAKLKSLENKEKTNYRDTVSFGLEDDDGGLVRVTVKSEQAEDFEKALQTHMARDEDEQMEIAEILFKLRDHFDIVDVQWPEVEEDEEEDVALAGEEQMPVDGEALPDMGGDLGVPPPEDTESQAMSALSQVIDMMKSEAEARKAEAKAKEAEAKAKEASAIIAQATAKVKQEEQFLDMDTYNKAKKDEEREAKRLAQLARWKHEMSNEEGVTDDEEGAHMDSMGGMGGMGNMGGAQMPAPEEEERATFRRPDPMPKQPARTPAPAGSRVSTKDIANFILNRVK